MADSGLLIVAAEQVAGPELRKAVSERAANAATGVRIVAPALTTRAIDTAMGNVDDAIVAARRRLERSLDEVRKLGIEAEGAVGDPDLRLAIEDALWTFDADEIMIVAHRHDPPRLESRGIDEAERSFEPPITELYVIGTDEPRIASADRVGPGLPAADPDEVATRSENLPPFSPRDVAGILVAIVGTGVLVVLAASCGDVGGGFDSCSVRLMLAGLAGLMNLSHVVA